MERGIRVVMVVLDCCSWLVVGSRAELAGAYFLALGFVFCGWCL